MGAIMVMRTVAALFLIFFSVSALSAQEFTGVWELDLSRSKLISPETAPKFLTWDIKAEKDVILWQLITVPRQGAERIESFSTNTSAAATISARTLSIQLKPEGGAFSGIESKCELVANGNELKCIGKAEKRDNGGALDFEALFVKK
jgi:hypothetical protein